MRSSPSPNLPSLDPSGNLPGRASLRRVVPLLLMLLGLPYCTPGGAATSEGSGAPSKGRTATSEGDPATAQGDAATSEGEPATSEGDPPTSEGHTATVKGDPATVKGDPPTATRASKHSDARPVTADPAVPGLEPGDPTLMRRLQEALDARGPQYTPRTHHLRPDGTPKFTNRLILETSPYLLQHAHNPVNWYPWGDEAFDRARQEGKPILLSIGYSTCHWCHVMERESFEDLEIARYLNEHFIAIKVDREERPAVDETYMTAVQLLTGRGGWPMTTVLTPDRQPFFGGTYFPARDGNRGARKGFLTILQELSERYQSDPAGVVADAKALSMRIQRRTRPQRPGDVPGPKAIHTAAWRFATAFDSDWGGFGRAPKFPRPVTLELLLRFYRRTGDPKALAMVTLTLEKMAAGGVYDQVGGGFHRYATDGHWLVPHFEKMLYDNAQLAVVYLDAFQLTGRADFARVARETLDYVAREMTAPTHGFYSATDADSPVPGGHDEEGYFFTWTPQELEAALGKEQARLVSAYYGVTSAGNFEGRSILNVRHPLKTVASRLKMDPAGLRKSLEAARKKLYQVRATRPPPFRDDKILAAWNGLMISAFARGSWILDAPDYEARAAQAADFVLTTMRDGSGRLMRSSKDGRARHDATLEDHAFLIQGLIDLYEATFERRWLEAAIAEQAVLDAHFADAERGGYFMSADDHEALLVRDKPSYDGAEPSGNAVAILNLLRLHELTEQAVYRRGAEKGLGAFAQTLTRGGTSSPKLLSALEFYLDKPLEIVLVGPKGGLDLAPFRAALGRVYLPNRILAAAAEGAELEALAKIIPLVAEKRALQGKTTAYVCEAGLCALPTSDPEVFAKQLARVAPLTEDGPLGALP